jgi:hypothetical protein
MARSIVALVAVVMAAVSFGCAPAGEGDELGEFGAEAADEVRAESFVMYRLRHDTRRCVSPLCGGVWVSRVNRSSTLCADGSLARECYVAEVDYSALGLSAEALDAFSSRASAGQAIVRAKLRNKAFGTFGSLGSLVVTEGWQALTDAAPTGPFYSARDNGTRCLRAPCANIDVTRLNYDLRMTIHGVKLDGIAGLSDSDIHNVNEQLGDPGVIVAGPVRSRTVNGSTERSITATQVYLRVSEGVRDAQFCDTSAQCVRTPYGSAPTGTADCYCALCPTAVTNTSTAESNQAAWQRVCSRWSSRCPVVRCAAPPAVACVAHACVTAPLDL